MAENSVENKVCRHCAADVRPNSEFCYNCGEMLAAESASKSAFPVPESNDDTTPTATKIKLAPIVETPIEEPSAAAEPTLKSAASMRRKSKIYQPKRVEITWEEHENAPNAWFVLAAIVLTLFAVGVFYLVIYLK